MTWRPARNQPRPGVWSISIGDGAHAQQVAVLERPRELLQRRSPEAAEEDLGERLALALVAALVEVEVEAPGGARLVVVVAAGEDDVEPGQVQLPGAAPLDRPRQRAEADAVGGATALAAADRSAGADRLAVARLQVGPGELPGQVVAHRASVMAHARAARIEVGWPVDRARRGGSGALSPAIRSSGAERPSEGRGLRGQYVAGGVDGQVPRNARPRTRSDPEGSSLKR